MNIRDVATFGIPRPPGSDAAGAEGCVARRLAAQHAAIKVPLEVVPLQGSTAENNAAAFAEGCSGLCKILGVGLPKTGPAGVATNGLPVFPPFTKDGKLVWETCGLDNCNGSAGRAAFDYHYHGDPYGCLSTTRITTGPRTRPSSAFPLTGTPCTAGTSPRRRSVPAPSWTTAVGMRTGQRTGTAHWPADMHGYHYHAQVLEITSRGGQQLAFGEEVSPTLSVLTVALPSAAVSPTFFVLVRFKEHALSRRSAGRTAAGKATSRPSHSSGAILEQAGRRGSACRRPAAG